MSSTRSSTWPTSSPPQADARWIGEAASGSSYLDDDSGGPRERLHQPQHDLCDGGTSCTWSACSRTSAASPPTATSARSGTRERGSTSPTASTADWALRERHHGRRVGPVHEEGQMALARVVSFDGVTKDRIAELEREIGDGPPDDLPAKEIVVLHDP